MLADLISKNEFSILFEVHRCKFLMKPELTVLLIETLFFANSHLVTCYKNNSLIEKALNGTLPLSEIKLLLLTQKENYTYQVLFLQVRWF